MIPPSGKSKLLYLVIVLSAPAAAAGNEATSILQTAGVQGGLVVHLGCGNGKLTAALHAGDSYLVHGLDADARKVEAARRHIDSLGLYGKVSMEHWTGGQLPYVDNLVNLLVADDLGQTPMTEVMRVLAPRGVACIKSGGEWTKVVKPWPAEIDQWTHFLHGPDNNAVAHDSVVGPPKYMQWVAGPLYCRSHETDSSVSAIVSARGRIFYILDEGPTGVVDERLPERRALVARDAFNGLLLWKRPLPGWGWPEWKKDEFAGRVGVPRLRAPATLTRRLVADRDRLFVTLGFHAPVTVINAGTGATVRECAGTENADEIISCQGMLVICARQAPAGQPSEPTEDSILAADAATGRVLWRQPAQQVARLSLAVDAGRVVFEDRAGIACLDLKTGKQVWHVADEAKKGGKGEPPEKSGLAHVPGTLLIHEGVVLAFRHDLAAFSLDSGKLLWRSPAAKGITGLASPPDLFVAAGLVWPGTKLRGYDLLTGQVKREIDIMHLLSEGHHPRCYRSKATDSFLILPKRGAEFVDLQAGTAQMRHDWLRGPCRYGVLPCNGLLYAAPHGCNCYPGVKLNGFNALAAKREGTGGGGQGPGEPERLQRGPAYAAGVVGGQGSEVSQECSMSNVQCSMTNDYHSPLSTSHSPLPTPHSPLLAASDWPTYRHDGARSGAVKSPAPADVATLWQAKLGGKLTQPVVAQGRLLVASVETQRVCCLDAGDGKPLWSFVAGGRVDGPPTVYKGWAFFGSADGWVYCVRVADGALAWRFQAAPRQRRVVAFGELESAWPVHGSVLVQNDVAYVAAGRSTYLDGGICLCALEPATGRLLHEDRLEGPYPDIAKPEGTAWNMEGATSDVLVGDGQFIYLRQVKWDGRLTRQATPLITEPGRNVGGGAKQVGRHLYSTSDLLDDAGFNRVYWMYSDTWTGRCKQVPDAGRLLVFDSAATYGATPFTARTSGMPGFVPASGCVRLFAFANDDRAQPPATTRPKRRAAALAGPGNWSVTVPVLPQAMVLADKTLLVAGPPDVLDSKDPLAAWEGRKGGLLWAVSTADGTKLLEHPLDSVPVFDGMAAAAGRLFMLTTDGRVICLGRK